MNRPEGLLIDYFEDSAVGERIDIGAHTFTAEEIKSYARRYDPQPFHIDEAAANASPYGSLIASGWHTATIWMRLMLEHRRRLSEARRARGEPVATLGPSPGFRDLRWLKPVYPGDTITYACEVVDKRASLTRPRWGLITLHNTGSNQHGELVLSWTSTAFVERRPQ